jgi:hypothetical protein
MSRRWRRWIPGIVIWTWLLVSLALVKRYPWVDAVFNVVWLSLLLIVAVASAIRIFRHRRESGGYIAYRGVPRWVITLFGGDDSHSPLPKSQDGPSESKHAGRMAQ